MSDKNKDTILAISRQLGIQSAGDGLLAKIRQTIDLLQEAAAERDQLKARVAELEADRKACREEFKLEGYDSGHLNDYGGGNIGWWFDYIRSELDRAHDFYQSQLDSLAAPKGGE